MERDELANERAMGLTEADYQERAEVFADMDRKHTCDYCGATGEQFSDGVGGHMCIRCCDEADGAECGEYAEADDYMMLPGEDMDGDFDSAMASAGYGTDEDYGHYDYDGMDYDFNMHTEGY